MNAHSSKTKQFCETSQKVKVDQSKTRNVREGEASLFFEIGNVKKNAAIWRDFLQIWKIERRTDGLVPVRFAIFYPMTCL